MGFLTDKKLGIEAAKYDKTGVRPQVVWPNGVLASTAIGIFVDIVCGWTQKNDTPIYISYDGNAGTLNEHIRLKYCNTTCIHYPLSEIGSPKFLKL